MMSEDEYHDHNGGGFSPSSVHRQQQHHLKTDTALTATTNMTATTAMTMTATNQNHKAGGYSIGHSPQNTMVRQTSTDDEEEDPFQGQTMYRAPTNIPSPRGNLMSDDER